MRTIRPPQSLVSAASFLQPYRIPVSAISRIRCLMGVFVWAGPRLLDHIRRLNEKGGWHGELSALAGTSQAPEAEPSSPLPLGPQ
jgi:hypothetical protein